MFGPRAATGGAPGDVERIATMGYDAFLAEQLNPTAIPDTECTALVNALPRGTFAETWAQLYDRRNHATWSEVIKPLVEVRHMSVVRMAYSKRQLFERMVEFWHNHFNIYGLDYIVRSSWTKWDETIRTHALGNFRTFLEATMEHPAMLYYLDNYANTNAGPNENYAREFFELHTLGQMNYQAPGGYIDEDVYEASRCFTGWTFEQDGAAATRGQFKYVHASHDRFQKWVLGVRIPNDQPERKDARDVMDLVCNHAGTARHLCWKLCRRFVADDPPDALVDSAAQVWMDNRTHANQIRIVLEHILSSDTFKYTRGNKFKRPLDWMISSMRALNMPYTTHDSFWWTFNNMGQRLFEWTPPNGPHEERLRWATSNNMLQRWNYMNILAAGWYSANGFDFSTAGIMPASLRTTREIVDFWVARMVQRPVAESTLEGLMTFLAEGRNWDKALPADQIDDKLKQLAAMVCMTPDFQRR